MSNEVEANACELRRPSAAVGKRLKAIFSIFF